MNVSFNGSDIDDGDYSIDRARVDIPEIIVEEIPQEVPAAIRPLLDMVWQSASWTANPLFDTTSGTALLNTWSQSKL